MPKIKSPVGAGKTAVNDPKDVKLIQQMLGDHAEAVGYKKPRTSGKIDQPTITAIGHFQKEVAKTRVTSVIEPGSKTFKMLDMMPRKIAEMRAPKEEVVLKGKVYQVKWRGQTYNFTEDQMDHAVSAIQSRLHTEAMRFMATLRNYQTQYREMKERFWTFFVKAMTPDAEIDRPAKSLKKASAEISKLVDLTYGTDQKKLLKALKQMKQAKIALDAAAMDINMLGKELRQSAQICEEMSLDLRDGAFDIVQLILVTNGVNPATAGASVAAAKNSVQEIANGLILKGQWAKEGGVYGSLKRVTFASIAGGFSGWIGGKVGKVIMAGVGDRLAARMVNARWIGKRLWPTANRWAGEGIEAIIGRYPGLTRKIGGEIVLQTVIRMGHKFFTGRAVAKALTGYMTELERIVADALEGASSESKAIAKVTSEIDKQGLAEKVGTDILAAHQREIRAEIDKALAAAEKQTA